jgi:hypothetical protein
MRSHKLVFVLGLIVLGGLGLVLAGCSSDDTPTSRSNATDSEYTSVMSEVNTLIDTSLSLVAQRLKLVDLGTHVDTSGRLSDLLLTAFGLDSVVEGGNWLILYDADLGAAYSNYYLDSIQFRNGQTVVANARNADRMTVRRRWEVTCLDTTQSHTNYAMVSQFVFTNINTEQVRVNATIGLEVESMDEGLTMNTYETMAVSMIMGDLAVTPSGNPSANGCPVSGTCQVSVDRESWRDTPPGTESHWEFMLTFADGLASATVTNTIMDTTYAQQFCSVE